MTESLFNKPTFYFYNLMYTEMPNGVHLRPALIAEVSVYFLPELLAGV